jgi:hypothetical protein
MSEKNKRIPIPEKVKFQLWVASGGRCEFNCCNKKLDQNVITKQKIFLGQHAHIIGDSPNGPRGDVESSKKLAHDPANLMLLCHGCHKTIDDLADDYDAELLRQMKKRHEDRIQRLYDIDETKESVAIILRHPIKRIHVPQFTDKDVQAAILMNSDFCHAPSEHTVQLDYRARASREGDPAYWSELVTQMQDDLALQLRLAARHQHPSHLSVFAFSPMVLAMQLGAFVGNKVETSTFQWDRTAESWKFRVERQLDPQEMTFTEIPASEGQDLAVALCFSGDIPLDTISKAIQGAPVVRFGVLAPTPALVESTEDIRHFRTRFTAFMAEVRNKGYTRIHAFPAMPLSLAVEFGRQLLPKADPAIHVWDLQEGNWISLLQLKV